MASCWDHRWLSANVSTLFRRDRDKRASANGKQNGLRLIRQRLELDPRECTRLARFATRPPSHPTNRNAADPGTNQRRDQSRRISEDLVRGLADHQDEGDGKTIGIWVGEMRFTRGGSVISADGRWRDQ